jgi:chromosome segregation ATPase
VRPVDTAEIQAEIEALESRKREIDAELENREPLADELASVEAERAALADDIQEKREELAAEQDRIEAVDAGFEETRERKAELEAKLETLRERRSDREDVRFRLETERETAAGIRDELEDVEAFNDHTAAILDALDDDNVERIWLERVEREIREGRRTLTRGFFDLHVIRRADGGAVYEDTVQHLSESEREVTGLVFALAGYLVHEVHEMCPLILLDSIEALDSGRIATLVEYLAEYADYLVVALLPEDAEAVDDRHRRITEI